MKHKTRLFELAKIEEPMGLKKTKWIYTLKESSVKMFHLAFRELFMDCM